MSENETLDPVDVSKLLGEFADFSLTDLVVEIKDLRDQLEAEKKAHAADEFGRKKAEDRVELLEGRINSSTLILNGDADVCIDCAAVKDPEKNKPKEDE